MPSIANLMDANGGRDTIFAVALIQGKVACSNSSVSSIVDRTISGHNMHKGELEVSLIRRCQNQQ